MGSSINQGPFLGFLNGVYRGFYRVSIRVIQKGAVL